jgi:two-component system chemotaxis response regulator CheB
VRPRILAIGSSTGGPQALLSLLPQISPALDTIPVLITQHMPPTFTTILAEHIGRATSRPSKEGLNGDIVKPGSIYVAPGKFHMLLRQKDGDVVIHLDDGPQVNFCRPAVDPMFASISTIFGNAALAVVLTGMGHDGANGGKLIANAGGSVIAQDETTSVVWGMPGTAAAAGVCSAVLPLSDIGPKINALLLGRAGR